MKEDVKEDVKDDLKDDVVKGDVKDDVTTTLRDNVPLAAEGGREGEARSLSISDGEQRGWEAASYTVAERAGLMTL